eukprot:scaffold7970_cov120-Skeletonema_dohrnii-CCMP3373.AAC.2
MKIALLSTLISLLLIACSSGSSPHVRRRENNPNSAVGRSDGSMVLQIGNGIDERNNDPTTITLQPHMLNAGAASKKVIDFFSNDASTTYSFEFVDDEDVIKIHRMPTSDTKTTNYSRKLLETQESEETENTTSIFLLTNIFLVFLCVLTAAMAA